MAHAFRLLRKPDKNYQRGEYWREEGFEEHINLIRHETTLPVVEAALPRHGEILDAGCGRGKWLVHLHGLGHRVIGVDRSLDGLAGLRQAVAEIRLTAATVEDLPFKDDSFAAVLSTGVVEHFPEGPVPALKEARRVLRPDGLLFVVVPYNSWSRKLWFHPFLDAAYAALALFGRRADFAEFRYDERDMRGFLQEAGFDLLSTHLDDFRPPKAKGIWMDYNQILGRGEGRWELNAMGRFLRWLFDGLTPWLTCEGILCIARKPPGSDTRGLA